jgi:Gpi18-like mannosyltransferase
MASGTHRSPVREEQMKQRSQSGTTTGLQETELTRGAWATWRPLLLIALALRLVLTALPPYTIDMSGYIAWSRHLASIGPTGLYEQFHVVYAPLFHYCLWLTGECIEAFHLNFFMHGYAIKLWSVAADLIGAMLLLRYAARVGRAHAGMPFALLYLLNPAVVFNASVWGQFDGIPAVMMLGVMLLFRSQKPVPAAWLFVAAVLVKPQSGLLAPLVLLLFLRATLSRPWKRALACWFAAFLGGIAIYLVVVLPFYEPTALAATLPRWVDPFWWLFDLYLRSVQDYPFGTANAWNLWYVLGAQTLPDSGVFLGLSHAGWGLPLLAPFAVWSLWLAGRAAAPAQKSTARDIPAPAQKSTARDIPTSALESTARDIPAPGNTKAPILEGQTMPAAWLLLFAAYLFMTKMHERYLVPALLMGFAAALTHRRLLAPLLGASLLSFLNMLWPYLISFSEVYWLPPNHLPSLIGSAAMVLVFAWTCVTLMIKDKPR